MIKIKRVYEKAENSDGLRVLVDRLWPRGLSKESAKIDLWVKDIAPSDKLRKEFNHEPDKWEAFRTAYYLELNDKREEVDELAKKIKQLSVTLLFAAKETKFNNAVVLKEYLESKKF